MSRYSEDRRVGAAALRYHAWRPGRPGLRPSPRALAAAVEALRASGLLPPDGPDPLAAALDLSYL